MKKLTGERKMSKLIDVSKLTYQEFWDLAQMTDEEREKYIVENSKGKYNAEDFQKVVPMTFFEELCAVVIFLFGVPGSAFSIPVLFTLIGYFTKAYTLSFSVMIGGGIILSLLPAPFIEKSLSSWIALQLIKYFSFKGIFEERLKKGKPYILVAPPHGVFPFGNILTMIAFPSIAGFSFRGLAASAALRAPIFRQLLCTIGAIDASRETAKKVSFY